MIVAIAESNCIAQPASCIDGSNAPKSTTIGSLENVKKPDGIAISPNHIQIITAGYNIIRDLNIKLIVLLVLVILLIFNVPHLLFVNTMVRLQHIFIVCQ